MLGVDTQVLVVDDGGGLAGIFTEKDLLNRVLAKGLSPDDVIVADVMTPNPDTVPSSMTVLEALQEVNLKKQTRCWRGKKKKMYHYDVTRGTFIEADPMLSAGKKHYRIIRFGGVYL